jgi:hypothetical protein
MVQLFPIRGTVTTAVERPLLKKTILTGQKLTCFYKSSVVIVASDLSLEKYF